MELQKRCKGCKKYLTVPTGHPCSICYTVNRPKNSSNYNALSRVLQYIDGYANRRSSYYFDAVPYEQPVQFPAYGGYNSPPAYDSGYYSMQPQPPQQPWSSPTAYSDAYYSPPQQALPPPPVYGNSYYNSYYQESPQVYKRKRAVLCGVTYKGHRRTLTASINNVRSMHQVLLKMGFPNGSICILTEANRNYWTTFLCLFSQTNVQTHLASTNDIVSYPKKYHIMVEQCSKLTRVPIIAEEEPYANRIPTRHNILMALEWLTKGCQFGDSLVFYYAGHGSRMIDYSGDEKDGYDEALCPVDYRVSGKILDDEFNAILVEPLPHGATLHSIMDTCFSGTLLDLPFLCRIKRGGFYKWEDHHPSHVSAYGGTSGGKAICISACDDDQYSADTPVFTGSAIGALTYSFIQTVQTAHKLTYGDLLDNIRKVICEAQQRQGLNAPFASTPQEPQLSSSTRFEIYSEPFSL
uniref:metacaspase-3-like n=1 Tax=Erigeron canadensis TaxID=72917 RepID=UPI001CB9312E|nr:metacaspase-3-like [Erigeron canadensis]